MRSLFPNIENARGKLERARRSVEGRGSRVAVANGFEATAKRRTICNIVKSAREKSTYVCENGEMSDGVAARFVVSRQTFGHKYDHTKREREEGGRRCLPLTGPGAGVDIRGSKTVTVKTSTLQAQGELGGERGKTNVKGVLPARDLHDNDDEKGAVSDGEKLLNCFYVHDSGRIVDAGEASKEVRRH